MIFKDRQQAGSLLTPKLASWQGKKSLVIGLARGGVVVAAQIAHTLSLPLDVLVVKKIPSPQNPELALGALAPDNVFVVDWRLAHRLGADEDYINKQIKRLQGEIKEKIQIYRKGLKPLTLKDRSIILVDDGVATGATVEAAIKWCRKKHAGQIILALPVVPAETVARLKPEVDELIVLEAPPDLGAVGQFYQDFGQVEDEEVVRLLAISYQPSVVRQSDS